MTAVVAQSLPGFCVVCDGDERLLLVLPDGVLQVECPHCCGESKVPVLISEVKR